MVEWAASLPWNVIKDMANKYRLEPEFLAAVIQTESSGNPFAIRAEVDKLMDVKGAAMFRSRWRYFIQPDDFASAIQSSRGTEWIGQLMGWGPMQIQGSVAREHGFKGWFPALCSWEVGIEYGCKHLRKKADIYGDDPSNLYSAYNAGSMVRLSNGMFSNQKNVDHFMTNYRMVKT